MKKAICALMAAGAALTLATPAPAAMNNGASVREIYEAARCFVDRDRRAAVALISSLPIDGEGADASILPEGARRCGSALASADTLHLRGAIAQALFFRDFRGVGLEPRRSVPLVNLNLPVQSSPPGTGSVELYRWADCVVRNDANRTERLLSSSPGSRAEEAAIERLRAFMSACAAEGSQLAVQPSELRSLLAQSVYHSMYRYWTDQLSPVRDQ